MSTIPKMFTDAYSKYVKKIDKKGNLKPHPRTVKAKGLTRVDKPVERQLKGDYSGTDPSSKRNKQLEEDMKKALR